MATKEQYEEFFNTADKDGSGSLNFDELIGTLRQRGYSDTDDSLKNFFKSTDLSGDNMISKDEYMVAMGQQEPEVHSGAMMRQLFRDFDKDGSGFIDKEELKQVFQELGKSFSDSDLARMVTIMDADSNDKVNYEEFIKHMFGK